jgi:hypothetical protein
MVFQRLRVRWVTGAVAHFAWRFAQIVQLFAVLTGIEKDVLATVISFCALRSLRSPR